MFLVVRSFEKGLLNGDRIEDLQRTPERDVPEDLNDLLERIILRDVPESYHARSAQIFSMALEAVESLPFMAYWLVGQEDPEYAFKLDVKPLGPGILTKRWTTMKRRLNISCRGLLEIQDTLATCTCDDETDSLRSSSMFGLKVDFLHRTVKDFLLLGKTQKILQGWNPGSHDVHESICKALLAQIKITPRDAGYWGPISQLSNVLSYHCGLIKSGGGMSSSSYLRARFSDTKLALGYAKFQGRISTGVDHAISRGFTEGAQADQRFLSDHTSNSDKSLNRPGKISKGPHFHYLKGRVMKLRFASSHGDHARRHVFSIPVRLHTDR